MEKKPTIFTCQDYNMSQQITVVFLFNYLNIVGFFFVPVTKGAQFDQFDWPRKLRSQVSTYNIDVVWMYILLYYKTKKKKPTKPHSTKLYALNFENISFKSHSVKK